MDIGFLFQNSKEMFQGSLSELSARTCFEKHSPKRIPNIGKYSLQNSLLAKL